MHKVLPFSEQNLIQVAMEDWGPNGKPGVPWSLREADHVRRKRQLLYLADHLNYRDLHCQTMVVEPDYIDVGFLDDYATYYSRCNASYGRKCLRVHFFRTPFDQAAYDDMVRGEGRLRDQLRAPGAYLGFTVLKPLPTTFVGRTCIAPYEESGGEGGQAWTREYSGRKEHKAHLAGLELSVSSLAYQEQDSVTAACATTAIWCALQKIAPLFDLAVPTPAQITRRASENSDSLWRAMPSEGLYLGQMCRALQSFGLDVEVRDDYRHELNVRETIRAYGSLGLPIILALRDTGWASRAGASTGEEGASGAAGSPRPRSPGPAPAAGSDPDGHAVVVCGIGIAKPTNEGANAGPEHERIVRLYVHDDQVGPYARARFDDAEEHRRKGKRLILSDPEVKFRTQKQDVYAIIVPVHPLIRVRDEAVRAACDELEPVLEPPPGPEGGHPTKREIRWDIALRNGHDIVEMLRSDDAFTSAQRAALVPHAWPRFVWKATAWCSGSAIADVFVDASDIERSFLPSQIVLRPSWREHLRNLWRQQDWLGRVLGQLRWPRKTTALLAKELLRLDAPDVAPRL